MTQDLDFDDIIALLIKADEAYFNSTAPEIMTDAEYDRLKKRAFATDPSHSYFSRIGSDIRGGKIKLPYQMGSLDQVYLGGDFQDWLTKYNLLGRNIVVTDKLDGISCMAVFRNGELEIAYSRGNGVEGADITRHVKLIKNLPKKLKNIDYLVVRAELIMKVDTFEQNWKSKFKNPRVTVAGTMNRSESNKDIIADIDFVAYEVVATNATPENTKIQQLNMLSSLGFQTVPSLYTVACTSLTDAVMTKILKEARLASPYELDGIVITADEIDVRPQRGSISLNPEHSCKFKVNDDDSIVDVDVKDVLWEISKSGYWKPRVEIFPVDLFGTTVTYATGFNGKFIKDNGIGPGAKVRITKSGTVIPYILEVVKKAPRTALPDESVHGKWGWNETGVEIVVENADTHPQVKFKQVLDFVEKLNVELLKESSLHKLFEVFDFWVDDYQSIILTMVDLKQKEWEDAIGSNGAKIYLSLHRRLQNAELATLIGASKYMGIGFGVRKAKALIAGSSEDDIWNLTAVDIAMMEGFDTKTAAAAVKGLKETKVFVDALLATGYVNLVKIVKTDELKDVQVVMTGFRDPDLAAEIEKRGGKMGSSVSKKTTYLLTYDANSNSGKSKKARDLGVTVMTPDDFKDKFNL